MGLFNKVHLEFNRKICDIVCCYEMFFTAKIYSVANLLFENKCTVTVKVYILITVKNVVVRVNFAVKVTSVIEVSVTAKVCIATIANLT